METKYWLLHLEYYQKLFPLILFNEIRNLKIFLFGLFKHTIAIQLDLAIFIFEQISEVLQDLHRNHHL